MKKVRTSTYLATSALLAMAMFAACSATNRDVPPDETEDPSTSSSATVGSGGASGAGGDLGVTVGAGGGGSCDAVCSGDLHTVVDCNGVVQKTCPNDQGCAPDGSCIPACEAAKAAKSTVGCEYYTQPLAGFGCFAAYIANTWTSPITINVESGGASQNVADFARIPSGNGQAITYAPLPNGQLPAKEVAILFLAGGGCPGGVSLPAGGNGAFHITTSAPVVGYDIDPYGGGSSAVTSATLLIPTSAWDINYIAVAPWPFGPNSQNPRLTITASEDATDVTISPTADIAGGYIAGAAVPGTPKGVPFTYSLNKGQSLWFEQQQELTGSAILSTKPIGVSGSSGCINIDACCCDGAHQQIPPVRALGSEYVAVRYRNRVDGKEEDPPWRIVGAVDGTTLSYDPGPPNGAPSVLASGEVVQFKSPGPFVVKSQDEKHPFYLSGHMTGGGDFDDAGDPEFVNIIPPQQYLSSYVFFADPTYPETDLILVRAQTKGGMFKDVTLDCAGVVGGWQQVDNAGKYQYTRVDLVRYNFQKQGNCDNGRREIHSDAPVGLTVWGWGTKATNPSFASTYVSYAYPAGASVQSINEVVVPPVPK